MLKAVLILLVYEASTVSAYALTKKLTKIVPAIASDYFRQF